MSKDYYVYLHRKRSNGEVFEGTRTDFKLKYGFSLNKLFYKCPRNKQNGWKLVNE